MNNGTQRSPWHARVALVGAMGMPCVALIGCNTIEGAGEDIEAAGDAIDDSAHDTNPYRHE